jgi:predicted amidohydrolase
MQVAVIQLSSQDDVAANLSRVRALVDEAAAAGAELVALPENFAFMGEETGKREIAESTEAGAAGPITKAICDAAQAHGLWIVAGGMPEASGDAARPYNTSLLVAPDGRVAARYRKMHLFDVALSDGSSYLESGATKPGTAPVVAELTRRSAKGAAVKLGMTICYDVRFPELYRHLVREGSRIVTVPAAFTLLTGKDHWHVLLRARAIENQVFVVAPAQHGRHPKGRMTYGKSMIVDPWGDVLAQAGEGEGWAMARIDFAAQDRVRASLPALTHRCM